MSPAISREKGSGTAMDWSRFSTPSSVRSPARGGVTASSTGGRLLRPSPNNISSKVQVHIGCLCLSELIGFSSWVRAATR